MSENYGPKAFQSNAFQSNPIAFQMDPHLEEGVRSGTFTPESAPVGGALAAEAARSGLWAKQGPVAASWASTNPPSNLWSSEDESNPTP